MKTKLVLLAVTMILVLSAFRFQEDLPAIGNWQDLIVVLVFLLVSALGAPLSQWLCNTFKMEERAALAITAVVAGLLAILQMWLSRVLDFGTITLDNFPQTFAAVFTVATFYYQLLKKSPSFLGNGGLLKGAVK